MTDSAQFILLDESKLLPHLSAHQRVDLARDPWSLSALEREPILAAFKRELTTNLINAENGVHDDLVPRVLITAAGDVVAFTADDERLPPPRIEDVRATCRRAEHDPVGALLCDAERLIAQRLIRCAHDLLDDGKAGSNDLPFPVAFERLHDALPHVARSLSLEWSAESASKHFSFDNRGETLSRMYRLAALTFSEKRPPCIHGGAPPQEHSAHDLTALAERSCLVIADFGAHR